MEFVEMRVSFIRLLTSVLVVSVLASMLAGGGTVCLMLADVAAPGNRIASETWTAATVFALAGALAAVCVFVLIRSDSRWKAGAIALGLGFLVAAIGSELLCRTVTPSWPARALHGTQPEVWMSAVHDTFSGGEAYNDWGQRDRPRSLRPSPGVMRIAFLGDSFLEEGAETPVSLRVESSLGSTSVEVVNLGVSATGPDEYHDRLRNVAAPLGATHCCLFLYAGNDFVSPPRTLASDLGIAAVEPRPSLLTTCGLAGWNHLLTNRRRPMVRAWLDAGSLAEEERRRHQALRRADDHQLRQLLLNSGAVSEAERSRLEERLSNESASRFFAMLRDPDGGKFRSYYLGDALRHAAGGPAWEPNSPDVALHWTIASAAFCRSRGIGLTVVVVPEAFQVDDRMRELWLPLTDMRRLTRPCREAGAEFVQRAREASLDVLDLHDELQGSRGAYLNLDGHWSDQGAESVALRLARHLRSSLLPKGDAR